jgi:hypothetical protein
MVISNTTNLAGKGDVFFYGISVRNPERVRLHDTGVDGKKIKQIFKKWRALLNMVLNLKVA